jgi:hypothetical protein
VVPLEENSENWVDRVIPVAYYKSVATTSDPDAKDSPMPTATTILPTLPLAGDDDFGCENCGCVITEAQYDATADQGGWCARCFAEQHATCKGCKQVFHRDDMDPHPSNAGLCIECGGERNTRAAEDLRDLVERIIGRAEDTDDFDRVRRALAVLKGGKLTR